jgi:hypothetical protein
MARTEAELKHAAREMRAVQAFDISCLDDEAITVRATLGKIAEALEWASGEDNDFGEALRPNRKHRQGG